jgi:hypothetical protein
MTLLELIQQVTGELGLPQPPMVVGSTDPQIIQFLALLNRLGADLVRQYDWQILDNETTIQTKAVTLTGDIVAGSAVVTNIPDTSMLSTQWSIYAPGVIPFAQIVSVDNANQITMAMPATETQVGASLPAAQTLYDLPADWGKQIAQTEWDRTNRWPLMGPQSPQDWQSFKSGIVYAGPRLRFRVLSDCIAINPLPADGYVLAYEYISKFWVQSAAGVRQARFTSDTDGYLFPDSLMITGLKAQWKAAKGLDGTYDLGEFRSLLEQCKSQDKSAKKLSLSPYQTTILLTMANIADGNWPPGSN